MPLNFNMSILNFKEMKLNVQNFLPRFLKNRLPHLILSTLFLLFTLAEIGITSTPTFAETAPEIIWEKSFGGKTVCSGSSVLEASDGGFIVAGCFDSYYDIYQYGNGGQDIYLLKTDSTGYKEWQKYLGGIRDDLAYSMQRTSDGEYIIVGSTRSYSNRANYNGMDTEILLVKVDATGTQRWKKTFGGEGDDIGPAVQQTTDDGYIIAGETDSIGAGQPDAYLIKTSPTGSAEWETTFGGTETDRAYSVQQTADKGYILVGSTDSMGAGALDVYLVKTDSFGKMIWEKTYGGISNDEGYSVQITPDGGYIITGRTFLQGVQGYDLYLLKTDASGNIEWEKTFGGKGWETGKTLCLTSDNGYLISGWTNSVGAGKDDAYLLRTDAQGNQLWETTLGGAGDEEAHAIQQTSDQGFIIAGRTNSLASTRSWSYDYRKSVDDNQLYLVKLAPDSHLGIRVLVNNHPIPTEVPPIIKEGTMLLPFRAIAEAMGATVDWQADTHTVTLTKGEQIVKLQIGEKSASVNGSMAALEVPAEIINGHTLVPLRFIGESLNAHVTWDEPSKTARLTT